MFCSKCGAPLEEGSLFCGNCGSKVEADITEDSKNVQANSNQQNQSQMDEKSEIPSQNNQGVPVTNVPIQGAPTPGNQSYGGATGYVPNQGGPVPNNGGYGAPNKNGMSPKTLKIASTVIFVVVGIISAVVVFLWLQGNKKETINLNDYCKVKFDGYDTDGTADLTFNYDQFEKDVLELEGVDEEEIDDFSSLLSGIEEYQVVEKLENTYRVKMDKNTKLKNGDKVTIKYTVDTEAAEELGYNLVGETKEVKVEGLTPIKEVDPFESVRVEFKGTSPDLRVEIINDSDNELVKSLYFDCDKRFGIKKGDKITLSVDCDESYALMYGYRVTKDTQTYECKDVDYYANQLSDLSDENLKGIQEQSKNVLVAYFAENSEYIKAGEFKYEGYYLLNLKNGGTSFNGTNLVITLYSAEVKSLEEKFKPTKVYFPVQSSNVVVKQDGTIHVEKLAANQYDIYGDSGLEFWYTKLAGYTDIKKLYEGVITSNINQYDYVMTDSLKKLHEEK